ncbi:hypothetical protein RHGRI_030386 [Rhododendron griersonianum]|uniref:uridine/cytidine kinase n=1 Tax=Rhododendron griersonianum TaxID=479676 RepID=A0AAV6IMR1_9ERIC|nr:hypothetical protein RHGRI_030386 [Rhododendron griersonianum]
MSLDLLYKWKEGSRPSGKPRGTSFQSSLPTRTSPLLSSPPLGNHSSLLSTVIPKGSTPAIHPTANHETSFKTLGSCLSPKNSPLPADGLEKMSFMNKCASWDEIVVGVRLYVLNIHIASSRVAGGAASGKTPVCDMIIEQLRDQRVVLVNLDSFYHNLTEEELSRVHEYNFDHPDKFFEFYTDIPEEKEVKYASRKLYGYVPTWWERLQSNRLRQYKQPIRTWPRMRRLMSDRFLQTNHAQMLYQEYRRKLESKQSFQEFSSSNIISILDKWNGYEIKKEEGDRVELDADKEVAEEIVKEVAIQVDDTKIVTDVGDQVVEDQNNCTLEVVDTNISELHNSKMDDCYKVALQVATVERVDDDIDKPKEEKSIEFITTTTVDEHSLEAIQLSTIGVHVPLEKDILMAGNNFLDTKVNPSDVIILEGILIFHDPRVRDLMNMKIFVDTDADVRLARRIRRDTVEKGRDINTVLDQYSKFVKPAFDDFILPTKKYADIIIPRGGDNHVAVDLIVQHIRTKLGQHDLCKIYPNLYVIQTTFQVLLFLHFFYIQIRGMHTLIRDSQTTKHDFVFYADRLIRLVVEHGLGHLPFTEKQVITPTDSVYTGVDFCKRLCGVSVIRSGESMENALRACCKGIKIGKILIHREGDNGQQLIYEKLPNDISDRHVLLLDPILGTGNSAVQAISLLVKKGVPESNIIFLNLISAPQGVHVVCKRFPRIKIVTSEIEVGLNKDFRVVPGMGEFGDRYFGTDDDDQPPVVPL